MATVAATATVEHDRPPHLRLDSIPTVDLHLLSQSELYSLSKCSNSSFDLNRCDDVVIPKIDRSVFNESAGSRKQTYSRLRLAPAVTSMSSATTTIRRRTPHLRPSIAPVLNNVNDSEQVENSQIIHALKQLFKSNPSFDDYVAVEVEMDPKEVVFDTLKPTDIEKDVNGGNDVVPESLNSLEVKTEGNIALLNSEMKRKRGRPRKHEKAVFIKPPVRKRRRRMHNDTVMKVVDYDSEMDKELVNCRGVKVDLVNLGKLEDPYGPEIRNRTEGLLTADELLGFLRGLKGEWGTTRKKRRVVDASDFGDALPKGWRLSLCIKRKGGRVWVFCRRYVSPSGRYFESCKDVSKYLISVVGEEKLDKSSCTHSNDCDDSASKGASGHISDPYVKEDLKTDIWVPASLNLIEVEKDGKVVPESLNSTEVENNGNIVIPELSNSEMRRKRGRPRKHENAVFISPPVRKRMRNDTVKKVVVYDSDMDREILNCKGVRVDLLNLGKFEDPYGSEIRKRTEGLLTADELLGFLRGLKGEWGTTRKKRRVVDASDFGDALPKGWRLILCIKRKDGRVWVFCRRYISPSGRQFESCKDISTYLLSVVGEENLEKPSSTHNNDYDDSVLKGDLGNAADHFAREDLKTNNPVFESLNPIEGNKDRKIVVPESLNPIEVENGGNVVSELSNSERTRKRGRPPKHEKDVILRSPVTKRMHNDTVMKVVVYDSEMDKELVNCRGVKVDLVNLGKLEDPYGLEIRKRTEGLLTADELLGFLRGLKGEWGTTRKKRRVVDASDFGDALPKGWRLSLCIKRKDGRVWLFCRRYISPSGRQFESCKDVSGYLLSIVGEENLETSCAHSNDCDDSALKVAPGNAAEIYFREDLKRIPPVHSASAPPISLPTSFENQVTSDIGDRVVGQEVYKCLKCFMIFEGKIDLLDHQALAHTDEGSQLGSAIPDWSIVIGGIFECKFCHKTFYEKNQYNGHIGTHVTDESKNSEASAAPAAENTFDAVSISAERDDATETYDAHIDDKLISASSQSDPKISFGTESKIDEIVHDLNMDGDVLVEESCDRSGSNCNVNDNDPDVFVVKSDDRIGNNYDAMDDDDSVVKSDFCLGNEASMSVNEINGKFKTSGRTIDGVDAKSDCISGAQTLIVCEKKGFRENVNDTHVCSSSDKLTSEKEKVVNTESSSGGVHGQLGLDEERLAEGKKPTDSESLSLFSPSKDRFKTVTVTSMISSKKQESPQKLGFDATVNQVAHGFDENRFSYGVASSKLDEPYKVRSSALDYYKENKPVSKETFHLQNNVNDASLDKSGGVNLDNFHNYKNNGSINSKVASFGSSQNGLNAGVTRFNTEKQLDFSSPVPPGNQQAFDFQDDVTGLYDSAHGSSEKGLLDHFCVAETSDDIFGNKLYSTPLDGLKFDEGIHELSLAFGNPHPHALFADKMSVNEQKKDGVNCSVAPSKIENLFDVQTDLSMVNNSMVEDLKRGSESVGRSFSLSRNSESRAFQHNGNTGYSARTWEDPRLDEFRSSNHNKFMIGSGSNQHHNEAVPRDMWKPTERNQLQSGFVNPHAQPQPQPQSPSFHSFDIMSAKAEDGVFRHNERYNGGMSVGRSEPVEFRFLAGRSEHNPHALQGGSRVFPYNNRMEQAYDSNLWMGNNGMMPNMGGRNVITSICAWCRNQFQMPAMAIHPESQGGAGSLCPTCSAGFSGQVNML